jgi:Uncharacterized conserved protein
VIVSLPDSHGRYVDARVLDMWTNVVWSTSSQFATRAAGIKAQTIAFVGPGWQGDLPKGVTRVDVPTRNAWVSVRIQSNGTRDLTAVRKLQRAIRVAPLSVYAGDTRSASITPPSSNAADAAAWPLPARRPRKLPRSTRTASSAGSRRPCRTTRRRRPIRMR